MSRALATVRIIKELIEIKGADSIELALVDGWQCVVKKGEFVKGDQCVYFEIDSVLPDDKEWSKFMAARHYRVKTAKFMKQLAQGLALPMSILPPAIYSIDTDVTEILGVTKWLSKAEKFDLTVSNGGRRGSKAPFAWMLRVPLLNKLHYWLWPNKKGGWPEWLPKTDETRVQNIRGLEKLTEGRCLYTSEKLDGQSVTIFYHRKEKVSWYERGLYGVCSRNVWLKDTKMASNWTNIAREEGLDSKLKDYCEDIGRSLAIQGEICGPGIQGNYYELEHKRLFVFNVYDIGAQRYLSKEEKEQVVWDLDLEMVPDGWYDTDVPLNIEEWLTASEGHSDLINRQREGIVVRDKG